MKSILTVKDLKRIHDSLWSEGEKAIMVGIANGNIILLNDEVVTPKMKEIIEQRFLESFGVPPSPE